MLFTVIGTANCTGAKKSQVSRQLARSRQILNALKLEFRRFIVGVKVACRYGKIVESFVLVREIQNYVDLIQRLPPIANC